jgi:hypothetical protein
MMVGEGETEEDDRQEDEDKDFQEAKHTSLIRPALASSSYKRLLQRL